MNKLDLIKQRVYLQQSKAALKVLGGMKKLRKKSKTNKIKPSQSFDG